MKKRLILILSIIFAVCISAFTVGCNDAPPSSSISPITFTMNDNGSATIEWQKVDGASAYKVYKAPSRYGSYTAISSGTQTETSVTTTDVYSYFRVRAEDKTGNEVDFLGPISFDIQTFGENTYVFSPTDPESKIKNVFENKYRELETAEFTSTRFSALFKQGSYVNVDAQIGYYTTVGGLGKLPTDVNIGSLTVNAKNSLCNFWRGVENLSVHGDMTWAVSQATSIRKLKINGNLSLSAGGYTSGGFLADTEIVGSVASGSQQQWLSRNSKFQSWVGNNWNIFFAGIDGTLPTYTDWHETRYTSFDKTEPIREKAYLTFDDQLGYQVFVPIIHSDLNGTTWKNKTTLDGEYIPLSDFYVARSDVDTADSINLALASGKHLILSAGVYNIDKPILVTNPNTVVLGLGLATLKVTDTNTDSLMKISDVDGVKVSGILFDAGDYSKSLLVVGEEESSNDHSLNPTSLSDLFFRVGGATPDSTAVDVCVTINSNSVLGDNFWVWRADHTKGVGWDKNVGKNGIIINGDNVRFYGLFVEHFLEYQTIWNGENGTTYFYQSEIPYDPPTQSAWKSKDSTVNGYSSYKVADGVENHTAYALGVYANFHSVNVKLENAIEAPSKPNVKFTHIVAVNIPEKAESGITHVINGVGDSIYNVFGQTFLTSYVGGQ